MMLIGPKKQLIMHIKDPARRQVYRIACFGPKRHYRKDGSCRCIDQALLQIKPWYRARTRLDPFGGKPAMYGA